MPQVVQLGKSDQECAADTHGLMKLDDDGKMVICDASKKGSEKFVSGGGGGGATFVGFTEAQPGGMYCRVYAISAPFHVQMVKLPFVPLILVHYFNQY